MNTNNIDDAINARISIAEGMRSDLLTKVNNLETCIDGAIYQGMNDYADSLIPTATSMWREINDLSYEIQGLKIRRANIARNYGI